MTAKEFLFKEGITDDPDKSLYVNFRDKPTIDVAELMEKYLHSHSTVVTGRITSEDIALAYDVQVKRIGELDKRTRSGDQD